MTRMAMPADIDDQNGKGFVCFNAIANGNNIPMAMKIEITLTINMSLQSMPYYILSTI